jgi:hypothetical protein
VRDFLERIHLHADVYADVLQNAGFSDLDEVVTSPSGLFLADAGSKMSHFFRTISDDVLAIAKEERVKLLAYFETVGLDASPDSAIVDIGWQASSLRSLQSLLRRQSPNYQLRGYYFATWEFAQPTIDAGALLKSYLMHLGEPLNRKELLLGSVEALEFFFTAPYPTIVGLEKKDGEWHPIHGKPENTKPMEANLLSLHEAALDFSRTLLNMLPPAFFHQAPLKEGYLDYAMKRFFKNPTSEEAQSYGQLRMRDSFGDGSTIKHLAKLPKLPLFNKKGEIQRAFNTSYWREGFRAQLPKRLKSHLKL